MIYWYSDFTNCYIYLKHPHYSMTYVHVAIDLTFYFQHVNLLFASEVPSRSALTDNLHVGCFVLCYSRNGLPTCLFSCTYLEKTGLVVSPKYHAETSFSHNI